MTIPERRLVLVFLLATLPGCSCGARQAIPTDSGTDAGEDGPSDAGVDAGNDAGSVDAFVPPDGFWSAPTCGPIIATSCPIQNAATVTACASGEGAVFFDGAHCEQSPVLDCGAERGAFRSFEECAVVCEAAGECDGSKIVLTNPGSAQPGCETPNRTGTVCASGSGVITWLALERECAAFRDQTECYGSPPPLRCVPTDGITRQEWEEIWTLYRRASLLPYVVRLECGEGGP